MSEDSNMENISSSEFENNDPVMTVDKRIKKSKKIGIWFFSISTVLMLISIISTLNTASSSTSAVDDLFTSTQSDSFDTSSWDSSWVPTGFTAWSNDANIAWKWSADNNCDQYRCISVDFISQYGCPSGLYAALNWLDESDVVVYYANATLPSLLPMQTAKLRFDDYQDVSSSGQMAEINCG